MGHSLGTSFQFHLETFIASISNLCAKFLRLFEILVHHTTHLHDPHQSTTRPILLIFELNSYLCTCTYAKYEVNRFSRFGFSVSRTDRQTD